MTAETGSNPNEHLSRIAAQMERMDSNQEEWAPALEAEPTPSSDQAEIEETAEIETASAETSPVDAEEEREGWENLSDRANLEIGGRLKRLARQMRANSKHPFSIRTKQISALLAFTPFVFSILVAVVRFMPVMPTMQLWSKVTWFIAFPIFLGTTGAFIGFLIGVLLDTLEAQAATAGVEGNRKTARISRPPGDSEMGIKSSVWVRVEDLEPDQRVAETVAGTDGTPILLRNTLLRRSHIDILKNQRIEKVRVEVMKYPPEGDLAMAG